MKPGVILPLQREDFRSGQKRETACPSGSLGTRIDGISRLILLLKLH